MHTQPGLLVAVGSFCLLFTLVLAWCLAGVRASSFMKRLFPNYQYLLKSHIDFLLMTGLLMLFYLLFTHFSVTPPAFVLIAMSIGSVMNPVGFLMLAVKPELKQSPASPFGLIMVGSFTATTVGYAGAALIVAQAAIHAAPEIARAGQPLTCIGAGSPTVVIEPGLGGRVEDWKFIAPVIARDTQVCIHDRASSAGPKDGAGVADTLHALLDEAHVTGPLVLVGHSSGAQYVRVFASRYPARVAGMVLLDGQPAEAFTRLPAYPSFYRRFRRVTAVFPVLDLLGVSRFRGVREEFAQLPAALEQARVAPRLGNRPLIVVTAVRGAQDGWLPLQDELALLSTNHIHCVLPDATHTSLLDDRHDAAFSAQAIRDVVESSRARTTGDAA